MWIIRTDTVPYRSFSAFSSFLDYSLCLLSARVFTDHLSNINYSTLFFASYLAVYTAYDASQGLESFSGDS